MNIKPATLSDFNNFLIGGEHPFVSYQKDSNCWRLDFSNPETKQGNEFFHRAELGAYKDVCFFFTMANEDIGWRDVLKERCAEYRDFHDMDLAQRLRITRRDPEKMHRVGDFIVVGELIFHMTGNNLAEFLALEQIKVKRLLNITRSSLYKRIKEHAPVPNHPGSVFSVDGTSLILYMNDGERTLEPIYDEHEPKPFSIVAYVEGSDNGAEYPESEEELLSIVYRTLDSK